MMGEINQIFISYAREDLENAQEIYRLLTENHFSVWMDEKELIPGQDWKLAIEKSIKTCNIFIACVSNKSVRKRGYIQKELRMAYEILDTIPDGKVFIIPVRLDDCEIPARLVDIHRLDFFKPGSKEKLIKAIKTHLDISGTNQQVADLFNDDTQQVSSLHKVPKQHKNIHPDKHLVKNLPSSAEKAPRSPAEFRKSLKKAITNISINQDKSKELVKHELGLAVGRSGVSPIEYWEKGNIPANVEDVEKLARTLVKQKGITEKAHFLKFLASSGYEESDKLFNELSPELSQEGTLFSTNTMRQDWGEAPDPSNFFGRKREILEIERWISLDGCRVVALLGIGGIGKTILAAKIAQRVSNQYDYLIWRSVREAPPLKTIIEEFVKFLSHQEVESLPNEWEMQIASLLGYLRKYRCLLILDNVESVMQGGSQAGREGYDGYGRFIQTIGDATHKSCLLLTSREKPKELTLWDNNTSTVRCYTLAGLELTDLQAMLKDASVQGSEKDWAETARLYGGNPLALKVMAGTIWNLFDGRLERFLAEGGFIFGDIRNVLNQQFERLSVLEQNIMYWLAVEREPVPLETLSQDVYPHAFKGDLFDALDSLTRRSLVEKLPSGFTLQNVVMEYITDRLISRCVDEINSHSVIILSHISLAKTTSRDYVRENQLRLIVKPIINMLVSIHGPHNTEALLKKRLERLREFHQHRSGYDAGNLVTLFSVMDVSLDGCDFSNLTIWEANFQNVGLENTNFSHATFDRCIFTQTFGAILSIAFSPSGEYIAAGTHTGDILMWELKTRQFVLTFRGHTDWVRALCFSENGLELFSASDDQTVRMWNTKTGYPIKVFPGHIGRVMALAVDIEKQIMVSGGEDTFIRVWDVPSGHLLKEIKAHFKWVCALKFSPDRRLLLSGSTDETLKLWETDSYTCIRTLRGHRSFVWTAAFSPDGSFIASGGNDATIRIWRGRDGSPLRAIDTPEKQVRCLVISPQGDKVAIAISNANLLRVWDVKTGQLVKTLLGHEGATWTVAFSPKGNLLASGGFDSSLRLWSTQDMGSVFSYKGYQMNIGSIAFSPVDPSSLVSTYADGSAWMWDVTTGQHWNIFKKAGQPAWKVLFNPNGSIIACGLSTGLVHLLDAQTGRIIKSFNETAKPFGAVAFSPDGQALVTGGNTASVWDINTNTLLTVLPTGTETYVFTFDAKKRWLLLSGEIGRIQCWDFDRRELLHIFEGHSSIVWSLSVDQKTRRLASASSDHTIGLWNLDKMEQIAALEGHGDQVKTVSFSPDGQFIASGGYDKMVRIWDTQSLKCIQVLEGHTDAVWNVAFNCRGQVVASGSRDGSVRIWDMTTFKCVRILKPSRLYERMNITDVIGLNETQKENLFLLGAFEEGNLGIE